MFSLFPPPPSLRRVRETLRELVEVRVDDQQYHRIAVSNLDDPVHALERHWRERYRVPARGLSDYTLEELYVEFLEDYYAVHPKEADALRLAMAAEEPVVSVTRDAEGWDGRLPDAVEQERQAYWRRRQEQRPYLKVDLEQFRSTEEMTPEKARGYFERVGRGGAAVKSPAPTLGAGEFKEEF